MSGAASRNKGARAEVAVVNYLRQWWPDTRRYLAGDGRQPGDIDWHPLVCLEVKDRAASSWPSWCRQVVAEARPGMTPAVVRKTAPLNRPGDWECRYRAFPTLGPPPPDWGFCERIVDGDAWWTVRLADLVADILELDGRVAA